MVVATKADAATKTAPKKVVRKAAPKKVVKKEEKPYIQQAVRWINRTGNFGVEGSEPLDVVNKELNEYHKRGYKLFNTHSLGENPEAYGILYIFVLNE